MVTSGILGSEMVCTLPRNVKDAGSIPTLGTIFPIFITFYDNIFVFVQVDMLVTKASKTKYDY